MESKYIFISYGILSAVLVGFAVYFKGIDTGLIFLIVMSISMIVLGIIDLLISTDIDPKDPSN